MPVIKKADVSFPESLVFQKYNSHNKSACIVYHADEYCSDMDTATGFITITAIK